jgi:hypothetical protein
MQENLKFNFEIIKDSIEEKEVEEIKRLEPPLNLLNWDNPQKALIMGLRGQCAEQAATNGPFRLP